MACDYKNKEAILARSNGYCAYCGKDLMEQNWHRDHIVPRLSGGGNELVNLAATCVRCNLQKGCDDARGFERWIMKKFMQTSLEFFDSAADLARFLPSDDAEFIIDGIIEILGRLNETHPQFFLRELQED